MKINRDIWVCDDCMIAHANGDYPELDTEEETKQRADEIDAGFASFKGYLACDDFDDSDPNSVQYECHECGHCHNQDEFEVVVENEGTDDQESFRKCPECSSFNTSLRDNGRDEFSWSACDCCGSRLGGARTRMAELVYDESST